MNNCLHSLAILRGIWKLVVSDAVHHLGCHKISQHATLVLLLKLPAHGIGQGTLQEFVAQDIPHARFAGHQAGSMSDRRLDARALCILVASTCPEVPQVRFGDIDFCRPSKSILGTFACTK